LTARVGISRRTGLDLIRVGAAYAVFAVHSPMAGGLEMPLSDHGQFGVPVFFALSGFLIYRPFLRGPVRLGDYASRRVLRLVPALALVTVGIGLLWPTLSASITTVMWSLFVEAGFYLALPAIARLVRGRELRGVLLMGVGSLVFSELIPAPPVMRLYEAVHLPWWLWAFSAGMVLAVLERDHRAWLRPYLALAGVPILAFGWLSGSELWMVASEPLVVLGATVMMAGLLDWEPGRGGRLASLAADASYPFYLWHLPLLLAFGGFYSFSGAPLTLTVAAITSAVSVASVLLVERPLRDLWMRLRRSSSTRVVHQSVGPEVHAVERLARTPKPVSPDVL